MLEFMSHSCFLSFKIRAVVFVWFNYDRDIFNDGQSIAFQADTLDWVIGDETEFADSHFSKNLCANAIFAFVGSETEMDVSIYCIVAFFLEFVGSNFVHQSDAASFLAEVNNDAFTFFFYHSHGFVQLFATIASLASEDVARHATGMHSDQ